MKNITPSDDTQTLIGAGLSQEYLYQARADELHAADDFEGYDEWSEQFEQEAWTGARKAGGILIKKACEHPTCAHFQCSRSTRLGGIEI